MKSLIFLLFFAINVLPTNAPAQQAFTVKVDLNSEWMVYDIDHYEHYTKQSKINTIYFWVDAEKFSGDYLQINSDRKFNLFVNGKLMTGYSNRINIDSLRKSLASSSLLIGIYQKNITLSSLKTTIGTQVYIQRVKDDPIAKPSSFFRDFVVIASMILLMMFIVIVHLNPKLVSDYFSVTRIFSVRESDDNQIYTRITNSTNILFYIFCSLILGFYLMIILHFTHPIYGLVSYVNTGSFVSSIAKWLMLSLVILAIFFLKIVLVYGVSSLFGSKEIAGIHFFNWVRLLLIIFTPLSILLFFYFILFGHNVAFHELLLYIIGWTLCAWVFIIFFKLKRRSQYSAFHLFSYICATEIIPLMIIITVLYN